MSKLIKSLWFWYGLTICPILVLLSLFGLGYQIGNNIYSLQPFSVDIWLVFLISVLLLAVSEFRRSLILAKFKFQ